jgi:hypothetical protein
MANIKRKVFERFDERRALICMLASCTGLLGGMLIGGWAILFGFIPVIFSILICYTVINYKVNGEETR